MIQNYEDFTSIQYFLTNMFNKVQSMRNSKEDKSLTKLLVKILEIMNLKDFFCNELKL